MPVSLPSLSRALVAALLLVTPAQATQTHSADAPMLETAMASVFTVHSADAEDRFLGSAFLWGDGAVAVSNAHVVGQAGEVRLTDAAGHQQIGQIIASDASRDVAVIAVKPGQGGLVPAATPPQLGAEVWALGAPLDIEFTVTAGRISALDRQTDPATPIRMIQHDAALNPGSSGGPLIDSTGALVGMNAQIADGSRMFVGIAYAIPATDLSRIVQGLIDETLQPIPKLGLTARPVSRQLAETLNIAATGLLVDAVTPASLAERAGLHPGDVILAVNAAPLTTPGDLAFALESSQSQNRFDLTILRAGSVLILMADLAAADSPLTLRDLASPQRRTEYTLQDLGLTLTDTEITAITPNSPALAAGLTATEILLQIDGQPAASHLSQSFTRPILLLIQGTTGTRHVLIDPWATTKTLHPVGGANVLDRDVVVF
ncbi:MAG: trypsin-like peptidase domain-containing protein [Cypionkella sp.]|uniref:trypsin-like peptidase domain-containing protein n=1 Tax=Cypionkella sp. TaxID=2811411 RepID=UPI002ABBE905|nr:trypsin-like peptidase domain-containing protein [Cypionkella sp.]MDZ4311707.1 trypsin-like peptidase domain-containing protein [Cypionkella sp.]